MAIEIVDFPIKNGGSFHGKMLVHQMVLRKWSLGGTSHVSAAFKKNMLEACRGPHWNQNESNQPPRTTPNKIQ